MKSFAALMLAGLALAIPMEKRREEDSDREIATEIVVETVWTTTTVFVDGPTDAAFAERVRPTHHRNSTSSALPSSSSSVIPSSSSSIALPSITSLPPVPSPSAPAPISVPAPLVAPSAPAAAAASPKAQVAAPAAKVADVATSATNALKSGTGDGTFYDVSVGLGSCGTQATNNDAVVALATGTMSNAGNPNANPLCGKNIYITYNGVTHTGKVYDTCEGCAAGDIDLSPGFFKTVFPNGDGRVPGVTWYVA